MSWLQIIRNDYATVKDLQMAAVARFTKKKQLLDILCKQLHYKA